MAGTYDIHSYFDEENLLNVTKVGQFLVVYLQNTSLLEMLLKVKNKPIKWVFILRVMFFMVLCWALSNLFSTCLLLVDLSTSSALFPIISMQTTCSFTVRSLKMI